MGRVAIVVVTWNSGREIGECLDALGTLDAEILVVDNASADDTREQVRRRGVRLIANVRNAGFAGGVNQGVRATSAPLVLLLNPDAVLKTGIEALEDEFSHPEVGVAGGMLVGADGQPQTGFMARNLPTPAALIFETLGLNALFPRNPVNWHYRCLGKDPVTPAIVGQPAGAFLMFPRRVWESVGGFDERFYPVWFEDVDFCARVAAAGFTLRYNPGAVAQHAGGHSVGTLDRGLRQQYWYGSLLKYAFKHYRPITFWAVCASVVAGAVFRAVREFPRSGFKAVAVCGEVTRLAFGSCVKR